MTLIEILTAVVLVLGALLCIALIIYLGRITNSIKQLQDNISDLSLKLIPLLSTLSELSEKISDLSNEAVSQLEISKRIVSNVKEHVDKILELEEKIRWGIEDPVDKILNNFKAISNGINTFFNHLKK
jgi:peptidoglycan hydrolase CwlO-like protein